MPHTALATTRSPELAIFGWAALAYQLEAIGVHVQHEPMPGDTLGELDETTGVLRVRQDATLDDKTWLLQQVWNWVVIGPHAAPHARVVPRLRLIVPEPRSELPA